MPSLEEIRPRLDFWRIFENVEKSGKNWEKVTNLKISYLSENKSFFDNFYHKKFLRSTAIQNVVTRENPI